MAGEATHTEAAQGAVEHGSAGMPQLDFSTFPNQIFWLAVSLVVIYLILTKVSLPRISGILAHRAGTISGNVQKAEELKALAAEAQVAYDQAIASARTEAGRIALAARNDIKAELAEATAKADVRIAARAAESEGAIADIRGSSTQAIIDVAEETAKALVAALGGKGDAKGVAAAVAARMKG